MLIKTLSLGPLEANCYLIEDGGEAAVIDPGYPDSRLLQWVQEHKTQIKHILLTHSHCDHISGAEELRKLTGAPLCVGAADAGAYTDNRLNLTGLMGGAYPSTADFIPPEILLNDGDTLPLGGQTIHCLHTPGHTVGGCVYFCDQAIFTGDTLFMGSVGRTDFYGGSFSELENSLKKIVENCAGKDYSVYSGHGALTTVFREIKNNPYLVNL